MSDRERVSEALENFDEWTRLCELYTILAWFWDLN